MLEVARLAKRLGPLAPRPRRVGDTTTVSVLAPMSRFSLRLRAGAAREAVAGFDLAQPINAWHGDGERWSVRLGPDEWLIGAPADQLDDVEHEVARALDNIAHSLVDVSHRNVGLEIAGPGAADALNAGCPLDLHAAAFPAGTATRTLLGKTEIVLIRPTAAPAYTVETWRSFAPYVHAFLIEAVAGLAGAAPR